MTVGGLLVLLIGLGLVKLAEQSATATSTTTATTAVQAAPPATHALPPSVDQDFAGDVQILSTGRAPFSPAILGALVHRADPQVQWRPGVCAVPSTIDDPPCLAYTVEGAERPGDARAIVLAFDSPVWFACEYAVISQVRPTLPALVGSGPHQLDLSGRGPWFAAQPIDGACRTSDPADGGFHSWATNWSTLPDH